MQTAEEHALDSAMSSSSNQGQSASRRRQSPAARGSTGGGQSGRGGDGKKSPRRRRPTISDHPEENHFPELHRMLTGYIDQALSRSSEDSQILRTARIKPVSEEGDHVVVKRDRRREDIRIPWDILDQNAISVRGGIRPRHIRDAGRRLIGAHGHIRFQTPCGTFVDDSVRKRLPPGYENGHMIAKCLNGTGLTQDNLYPQFRSANRSAGRAEDILKQLMDAGRGKYSLWQGMAFRYNNDAHRNIPSSVAFVFVAFVKDVPTASITFTLNNEPERTMEDEGSSETHDNTDYSDEFEAANGCIDWFELDEDDSDLEFE